MLMRRLSRLGTGFIAVAVTAGLVISGGSAIGQTDPTVTINSQSQDYHIVTLITGDRVTLAGGRVAVHPGPGRAGIGFLKQRRNDRVHVIPTDALPLLRDDRLDPRLFDITELIRSGYADSRTDLPLIVTFTGGATARAAAPNMPGAASVRDLPAIGGQAVRVAKAETAHLWDSLASAAAARSFGPGIDKVWLDGIRQPSLDVSVPHIGAPTAWAAGYDGTGQVVAVLDTGIDANHPDLVGQVVGQANFTEGEEDNRDLAGHGTHVASTIAGTGAASGGQYLGVAPGARLLDGKVCVVFGCAESWILAGMQWAVDQGADIVNLSLGGADTPEIDPLEQAVQTLTDQHDVLFVIASGNTPGTGTVSSPATADAALAVGAVDDADELAFFSSQGPRVGDSAIKPDLTAPGVGITAARSADFSTPGEPYITADGTSMATPHVAGAAAILAQRHPDWGPEQLKAALMASAAPHASLTPYAQGAGRVDIARAIEQSVISDPPSVSFGRALWPHDDDPVLDRTITYRNLESTEVTLTLTLAATGPDGGPAPDGMFRVSATSVTVPAGGEAEVTLTADTRVGSVDGLAGGRLVATAGDVVVQTPFAVDREEESYELTVVSTGRSGEPTADYGTILARLDRPAFIDVYDPDGTATVRLPRGQYVLGSMQFIPETQATVLFSQPRLDLTSDRVLHLDARLAEAVEITVPKRNAVGIIDAVANATTERIGLEVGFSALEGGAFTVGLPPDGPAPYFRSVAVGTFLEPDDAGLPSITSPYVFHVAWFTDGHLFTGLRRDVAWRDLATVRAEYAAGPTGALGSKRAWAATTDGSPLGLALDLPVNPPSTQTEYYNTDAHWVQSFDEFAISDGRFELYSMTADAPKQYEPGRTSTEKWNHAVFSPGLPETPYIDSWASRLGDTLAFFPPMYSDSVGRDRNQLVENATITVTRNGSVIHTDVGSTLRLDVPPSKARYGIAVVADLGEPWTLSTHLEASWTFTSSHVDGDEAMPLPISMVRFAPPVDLHNAVPTGKRIGVPVSVVTEPGARTPRTKRLTVEVSFDDGQTWRRVPVVTRSGQKVALVNHPHAPGFVSLRGTAEDVKGNTATVTVIRAYRTA